MSRFNVVKISPRLEWAGGKYSVKVSGINDYIKPNYKKKT